MPWLYNSRSGKLTTLAGPTVIEVGYSGAGAGKNNPDMQNVPDVGPIPRGAWTIVGMSLVTADHGPCVLRLAPRIDTETYGRDGFLIHGDSISAPGSASKGCIILSRPTREKIWASGDKTLVVT